MRFNCECCGYATDKKSSMTTHEKTKKHASNLVKSQIQTGEYVKEQHERDLMGLEDVNVIAPKIKVVKPKKYTMKQNRRIIENWVKMTTNRKHYTVTHLEKAGYYVKYIEEHNINIQEVEQWIEEQEKEKKARDIVWHRASCLIERYNKLVLNFAIISENGESIYPSASCKGGLSAMDVLEKYGITTEKLDDMDKEFKIEYEEFKRVIKPKRLEKRLERQKEQVELVDMLYFIDDEDLKRDMISEFVELKHKPKNDGIRDYHITFMTGEIQDQCKIWLTMTDDEKLTEARDAIPYHEHEISKEIIERYYDSYTRGYVMK